MCLSLSGVAHVQELRKEIFARARRRKRERNAISSRAQAAILVAEQLTDAVA